MEKLKIAVIIGSTRPGRFGDKPAKWIFEEAKKMGIDVELLDLRDYPLPLYNEVAPISNLPDGKYSSEIGKKWADKINEFDGYIVTAAEYNHGYPAVIKNAIDYAYTQWMRKPIGFVGYGSVGGVRSIEQLRQVVIQLEMVPIQNSINIPEFWKRTNADGSFNADGLEEKPKMFLDQLMWWAKTLKTGRGNK